MLSKRLAFHQIKNQGKQSAKELIEQIKLDLQEVGLSGAKKDLIPKIDQIISILTSIKESSWA